MHVVLEDLRRAHPIGALVENEKAAMLSAEGVTSIAVEPGLFAHNSVSGFTQKHFGYGIDFPSIPGAFCQTLLFVVPYLHTIRWSARVVPSARLRSALPDERPQGVIRLITDSSQAACHSGGLSHLENSIIDMSKIADPNEDGAWIVSSSSRIDVPSALLVGFALYGFGRDLRVTWIAISQTE